MSRSISSSNTRRVDTATSRAPAGSASPSRCIASSTLARAMSVMVQGRFVYEMMGPFWPNARTDESLPGFLREYGETWTDIPKVLVSRTRTTAEHNTRIIGGGDNDAIEQLAVLRR